MHELPQQTATFCVDGHVRVYHGEQTTLPRHYVARQKLCLRATTDYWVNALDGRPFFLINQAVDPGLLKVLEQEIIPRLQKEAPHQPTTGELEANPLAHCFTVVFDREGYGPEFFKRMRSAAGGLFDLSQVSRAGLARGRVPRAPGPTGQR